MNTVFSGLNKSGRYGMWRFAILLLISAGLALPAERTVSGSTAENAKDGEWACTHSAKPNTRIAARVLGKVNPLRLWRRLDAATTDLAIRFSSWPTNLPASPETEKAANGIAAAAASAPAANDQSERASGRRRMCPTDGELFKDRR